MPNIIIDKKLIVSQLIENLELDLKGLSEVATSAKEYVTDGDVKPDGKYDTRAIEASYLAGAQEKRVEEIKLDIQMLKDLELHPSSTIQLGSLAKIKFQNQNIVRWYFISSTAGGSMLNLNGNSILVISVFSPIGNAALNLEPGDTFEVETPTGSRQYLILEIN
jgi:transcription elongation GreA/GreB family factor